MVKIVEKNKNFRKIIIKTARGDIQTPSFMPDATRGYVKAVSKNDLEKAGICPMVVNTFHLYLQPGMKIIKKQGGIHNFMNWHHPLLSDSGGFQIFSLIHKNPKMGKILEDKVIFKSPIDGSLHELTPEKSIKIQFDLGVDMMVCLDDCPPNEYNKKELENSVKRTIKWAKRCRREYDRQVKKRKLAKNARPLLFSVIQGGNEKDLRKYCADELIKIGFDGYGFGARPVDENGNRLEDILRYTAGLIPENAIRFALGIGNPKDIVKCASYGWDLFDCVIPTREARHGRLFLEHNLKRQEKFYKTININNSQFPKDFSPINPDSKFFELREHTKGYLYHLFKMKEPQGARLATLNNLEFYMKFIATLLQ